MTTTAAEFQDLATELILDEFGSLAVSTVINKKVFTYSTQTYSTSNTVTLPMIKDSFSQSQVNGENIKATDYKLIGRRQLLTFVPSLDNCEVIHGGEYCNIIKIDIDNADAVVTLHVRPL